MVDHGYFQLDRSLQLAAMAWTYPPMLAAEWDWLHVAVDVTGVWFTVDVIRMWVKVWLGTLVVVDWERIDVVLVLGLWMFVMMVEHVVSNDVEVAECLVSKYEKGEEDEKIAQHLETVSEFCDFNEMSSAHFLSYPQVFSMYCSINMLTQLQP